MDPVLLYYLSGEEVHAGDRIQHGGTYGRVVFVTDGDNGEFEPGYEDYSGSERGLMICDDDGGLTFIHEPDARLELVGRS